MFKKSFLTAIFLFLFLMVVNGFKPFTTNLVFAYTETTYYIHQDNLESVVTVTSDATISAQMDYSSYGDQSSDTVKQWDSETVSRNITERAYTGQIQDVSTSLQYYNARYYDSILSRFISADQMGGGNRYSYVGNNPISFSDPTGNYMEGDGDQTGNNNYQYKGSSSNSSSTFGNISPVSYTPSINTPSISSSQYYNGTLGDSNASSVAKNYSSIQGDVCDSGWYSCPVGQDILDMINKSHGVNIGADEATQINNEELKNLLDFFYSHPEKLWKNKKFQKTVRKVFYSYTGVVLDDLGTTLNNLSGARAYASETGVVYFMNLENVTYADMGVDQMLLHELAHTDEAEYIYPKFISELKNDSVAKNHLIVTAVPSLFISLRGWEEDNEGNWENRKEDWFSQNIYKAYNMRNPMEDFAVLATDYYNNPQGFRQQYGDPLADIYKGYYGN